MSRVYAYQLYSKNPFPFNIGAIAIKYFSNTNYSHYGLALYEDNGKVTFFDSTMHGVREQSSEDFLNNYTMISGMFIDKIGTQDFYKFFNIHRGKTYGFIQILGLLAKIFKILKHNPFGAGAKRIICNELLILYTNYRGLTNIEDTDSLDLNDTHKILKELRNGQEN